MPQENQVHPNELPNNTISMSRTYEEDSSNYQKYPSLVSEHTYDRYYADELEDESSSDESDYSKLLSLAL